MGIPFNPDNALITACANSNLARTTIDDNEQKDIFTENGIKKIDDDDACLVLYDSYRNHYDYDNRSSISRAKDGASSERFMQFVSNVLFVFQHNTRNELKEDGDIITMHEVTLNQFSDKFKHELPLTDTTNINFKSEFPNEGMAASMKRSVNAKKETTADFFNMYLDNMDDTFLELLKNVNPDREPLAFHPIIIGTPRSHSHNHRYQKSNTKKTKNSKNELRKIVAELSSKFSESNLNWASELNPDGVSIVHPPSDQGTCGSCWAFASTGTLEASVARVEAYNAYIATMNSYQNSNETTATEMATIVAQAAERNALIAANLSVQELVDCDIMYNQGCTGGNPILTYPFIEQFGLTDSSRYPYKSKQGTCQIDKVFQPIATVESWFILTSDFENLMELVLQKIGPIAVGFDASDPSFLSYKRGIYNSTTCSQNANHAMLIVGYGEENIENQTKRFWIARNSWGEAWGDEGYVRLARGNGDLGDVGLCGITRMPSVAVGGHLLLSQYPPRNNDDDGSGSSMTKSNGGGGELRESPSSQENTTTTTTGSVGSTVVPFVFFMFVLSMTMSFLVKKYRNDDDDASSSRRHDQIRESRDCCLQDDDISFYSDGDDESTRLVRGPRVFYGS